MAKLIAASTLGIDIGGANLKGADSAGNARSEPFEIWRAPGELAQRLGKLIGRFPQADLLAVTMTAELADCFATKAEGVASIVSAARQAAGDLPILIWSTAGEFVLCERAIAEPMAIAAANWHALATWAGRLAPRGTALLIDIGSTTTDIIPLSDGRPVSRGLTDLGRLLNHELVYTGMRRTPLCAVAPSIPLRGRVCPVAAELFATMLDAYLLLGSIPEDEADRQTADGRPATIPCAHDRLAHMVCCDREEIDLDQARAIAAHFAETQQKRISGAISSVIANLPSPPGRGVGGEGNVCRPLPSPLTPLPEGDGGISSAGIEMMILSGSGELLAHKIIAEHPLTQHARVIRLSEILSPAAAEAACAHAVAVLAIERAHEHRGPKQ